MSKKQIELSRQQLEEILSYLGYPIYSEPGVLTVRAFNTITRLVTRKVVEHNQLPSVIAEQWRLSATKKVRFFNIDWDVDPIDETNATSEQMKKIEAAEAAMTDEDWDNMEELDLPMEVLMEDVPAEVDVASEGADKLSDKYGWCVRSFEFEVVE